MTEQLPLFFQSSADELHVASNLTSFSDYVVYVDESGDHNLISIDSKYPVFVLALCVFHKRHYSEFVVPALEKFKFNHFGHDAVILHEHEIRKGTSPFNLFPDRKEQDAFINRLTSIIEASNFVLICCAIDKYDLRRDVRERESPYNIALGFCLETLFQFLEEKCQTERLTHVIVECRGKKEDDELELEFRRICAGENRWNRPLPFSVVLADKRTNSAGLQFSDLIARPVGLSVIRPTQENRAFDVLRKKFFCREGRSSAGSGYEGWGLKIYPPQKSEKPR